MQRFSMYEIETKFDLEIDIEIFRKIFSYHRLEMIY